MKHLLLSALLGFGFTNVNNGAAYFHKPSVGNSIVFGTQIGTQINSRGIRMRVVEFKAQDFCRVELPDFFYDVHYSVVGATVYFSGTTFNGVEKGMIKSNSLIPIKGLMNRCAPGSTVVFDDVKVIGPDKEVRTIDGVTLMLY